MFALPARRARCSCFENEHSSSEEKQRDSSSACEPSRTYALAPPLETHSTFLHTATQYKGRCMSTKAGVFYRIVDLRAHEVSQESRRRREGPALTLREQAGVCVSTAGLAAERSLLEMQ